MWVDWGGERWGVVEESEVGNVDMWGGARAASTRPTTQVAHDATAMRLCEYCGSVGITQLKGLAKRILLST